MTPSASRPSTRASARWIIGGASIALTCGENKKDLTELCCRDSPPAVGKGWRLRSHEQGPVWELFQGVCPPIARHSGPNRCPHQKPYAAWGGAGRRRSTEPCDQFPQPRC